MSPVHPRLRITQTNKALDFGDLPDTSGATGSGDYQTLLANNGPRHLLTGNLYLGACVDSETDGQQTTARRRVITQIF